MADIVGLTPPILAGFDNYKVCLMLFLLLPIPIQFCQLKDKHGTIKCNLVLYITMRCFLSVSFRFSSTMFRLPHEFHFTFHIKHSPSLYNKVVNEISMFTPWFKREGRGNGYTLNGSANDQALSPPLPHECILYLEGMWNIAFMISPQKVGRTRISKI